MLDKLFRRPNSEMTKEEFLKLIDELMEKHPEWYPDIVIHFADGNWLDKQLEKYSSDDAGLNDLIKALLG